MAPGLSPSESQSLSSVLCRGRVLRFDAHSTRRQQFGRASRSCVEDHAGVSQYRHPSRRRERLLI